MRDSQDVAYCGTTPLHWDDVTCKERFVILRTYLSIYDVTPDRRDNRHSHEVPQRVVDLYLVAVVIAGCYDDLH